MTSTSDCPYCGGRIKEISNEHTGEDIKCPACKEEFVIPRKKPSLSSDFEGILPDVEETRRPDLKQTRIPTIKEADAPYDSSDETGLLLDRCERVADTLSSLTPCVLTVVFAAVFGSIAAYVLTNWKVFGDGIAGLILIAGFGYGILAGFVAAGLYNGIQTIIRLLVIITRLRT